MRNQAVARYEAILDRMNSVDINDPDVVAANSSVDLAKDFVRVDRRRLVAAPDADRAEFIEQLQAWTKIGGGQPRFIISEVVDVAGDRLLFCRLSIEFDAETRSEQNQVLLFDESVTSLQRVVSFDPDDDEAAAVELSRLADRVV